MDRREFIKAVLASGMSMAGAVSLTSALTGCSQQKTVELEEVVSLFDLLDTAEINAVKDDYVRKIPFTIDGETREVLFHHPPAEVTFHSIVMQHNPQLVFGIGINEAAWEKGGDGVTFEIVVTDDQGNAHSIYSRTINPSENTGDRRWIDGVVDLKRFARKTVSLTLRTTCGSQDNCAFDWAGWSDLEIHSKKRVAGRRLQEPNVLLISLDTLRADHLGCYGHPWNISPTIDKLSQNGVMVRNAIAQSPWTLPSHMSILTGLYPAVHGVGRTNWELAPAFETMAEVLKRHGYRTAAFVDKGYLSKKYGYAQGFDEYDDEGGHIEKINEKALRFVTDHFQEKFFLFMHVYDIHGPYHPPEPYERMYYNGNEKDPRNHSLDFAKEVDYHSYHKLGDITDIEYLKAAYAGEVTYVDSQLQRLFALLEKLEVFDDTLVVVLSDHGESFFDHHVYIGHGIFLYDNEVRIPLIFKLPKNRYHGSEILDQVESIDVMPTVLEVLGISPGAQIQGRSLTGLIKQNVRQQEAYAFGESSNSGGTGFVRSSKWKYIAPIESDVEEMIRIHLRPSNNIDLTPYIQEGGQLYDLVRDPLEMNNIIKEEPGVAQELAGRLRRWQEDNTRYTAALHKGKGSIPAGSTGPKLTEEEREELRALGYVQ